MALGLVLCFPLLSLHCKLEPTDIAVVTGLGNTSRILGRALEVAISSAVLNSSLAQDLPAVVPANIVQNVLASSEHVRNGCPVEYVEFVLSCYLDALRLIWYVMTVMCSFGFCASLLVRSASVLKADQKQQSDTNNTNENHNSDTDTKIKTPPAFFD